MTIFKLENCLESLKASVIGEGSASCSGDWFCLRQKVVLQLTH